MGIGNTRNQAMLLEFAYQHTVQINSSIKAERIISLLYEKQARSSKIHRNWGRTATHFIKTHINLVNGSLEMKTLNCWVGGWVQILGVLRASGALNSLVVSKQGHRRAENYCISYLGEHLASFTEG
jgi:hypothetical protein